MKILVGFLKTIFLVTAPALLFLWISYSLLMLGLNEKSFIAWSLLVLFILPTLIFTGLALVFNVLIFSGLILFLLGRRSRVHVFTSPRDFREAFRPPARDVTPVPPHSFPEKPF